MIDGVIYVTTVSAAGTQTVIHNKDAYTGQEAPGFPIDLEAELKQKAVELIPEVTDALSATLVTSLVAEVAFSRGGAEVIAKWRVSDSAVLPSTRYGLVHYNLEAREFVGAIIFPDTVDYDAFYYTGDVFDAPIILGALNSSTGEYELFGYDRGFESVLWTVSPAAPYSSLGVYYQQLHINRETNVVYGSTFTADLGQYGEVILYYFNALDGSGLTQVFDPPSNPSGASNGGSTGTGGEIKIFVPAFPRDPPNKGIFIDVYDAQFALIETQLAPPSAENVVTAPVYPTVVVRPDLGKLAINFSYDDGTVHQAIVRLDDLSDQYLVPYSGLELRIPQLSGDGTVLVGLGPTYTTIDIVDVSSGASINQLSPAEEITNMFGISGFYNPAAPAPFWTSFHGTTEVIE